MPGFLLLGTAARWVFGKANPTGVPSKTFSPSWITIMSLKLPPDLQQRLEHIVEPHMFNLRMDHGQSNKGSRIVPNLD